MDPTLIPIAGMFTGVVVMTAVGWTLVQVLRGPVGQAIARRLTGRGGALDPELVNEVGELRHQLEQVQQRLLDAEERLDFSERLLAHRSQASAEPPS
jgi:hypothetical protein